MATITLVTTTHDRPECFALLERWIAQQTVQPDEWIVVNDSVAPDAYRYTMGQRVIVRQDDGEGLPSLCQNWLAAVPLVQGEYVLPIEDDDYYHEEYIGTLAGLLDSVDLAGVSHDVYFKLPTRRFMRMLNGHHASLAATGFRRSLLPQVDRAAKLFKSVFLDMYIWAECGTNWPGSKQLIPQPLDTGRMLHVGMKCMPGAKGLGVGHNPHEGSTDPNFLTLTQWIGGEAATVYRRVWLDHWGKRPGSVS